MMTLLERLRMNGGESWSNPARIRYEAADEIERLRAEVLEQCRLNGMGAEREARLMAQLAESQAREQALRDSLDRIAFSGAQLLPASMETIWKLQCVAREALLRNADHTALDSLLAAERAKERERIAAWIDNQRNDIPATGYEFAEAIRALGDE